MSRMWPSDIQENNRHNHPMILTSGEIYFIGEFDIKTGQRSEYVKIGIVRHGAKEERTSQDRLLEHQTGNPRRLEIIHTITTDAVEAIETSLHYMFARKRVYGEWMLLDGKSLEEAKQQAELLKNQMAEHIDAIRKADELKNVLSNGTKIASNIDSDYWYAKYQDAKIMHDACQSSIDKYNELLAQAAEDGEDVGDFVTLQERAGSRKFDQKGFKEKYPDIYAKFAGTEKSIKGRFAITPAKNWPKTLIEISPDLQSLISTFEEQLAATSETQFSNSLHNTYLGVLSIQAFAEWEMDLASNQIRNLCNGNEGIEGVCSWKREEKLDEKLNKKALAEAFPDLVEEFTSVSAPTKAVIVEPKASYSDR